MDRNTKFVPPVKRSLSATAVKRRGGGSGVRSRGAASKAASAFLMYTYQWMALAIFVTALVAWFITSIPELPEVLAFSLVRWFVLGVGFVIAICLGALINKVSFAVSAMLFFAYSAVQGVIFGSFFAIYTGESIIRAFLSASCFFLAMSAYGYFTKNDLSSIGSMLYGALIALIVSMAANIFIGSNTFDYVISIIGILIFLGLTAYDTQKICAIGEKVGSNRSEAVKKAALMGAFELYLDLLNLVLFILRTSGSRK